MSQLPAIRSEPADSVEQEQAYIQAARGRIVALPLALGLILLGVLLLAEPSLEGFEVTTPVAILILLAAIVLTNLFRFFASNRRERGLLFMALVILSLGAVLALMVAGGDKFPPDEWYPLVLVGVSTSFMLTYLAEKRHDRGLINVGLLMLLASALALMVTQAIIPDSILDTTADYFPLVIAFIGVTLVPLALRKPTE